MPAAGISKGDADSLTPPGIKVYKDTSANNRWAMVCPYSGYHSRSWTLRSERAALFELLILLLPVVLVAVSVF